MDNDYYQDCDDEEFRAIGLVLKERDTDPITAELSKWDRLIAATAAK